MKSSIYEENRKVFERAKIDRNNFLEKIIQLPFCIPNITQHHRICFMDRMFFQLDPYDTNNSLNKLAGDVWLKKYRKEFELDNQLEIFYKYWKTFHRKNEIEILKWFNEFLMEVLNNGSTSDKIKRITQKGQTNLIENRFQNVSSNDREDILHRMTNYIQVI